MSYKPLEITTIEGPCGFRSAMEAMRLPKNGKAVRSDEELAAWLIKKGNSDAKFSRGVIYFVKANFQAGFMIELDTYRIGREILSTSSSMHNELKELSGPELAAQKQKDLPEKVYIQIATYSAQVLRKIYIERRKHRHPDWQIFCNWIETLPHFETLIMPEKSK